MPPRETPLVNNFIYHIINRGNNSIPIFINNYDYQKFIQIMLYYQKPQTLRLSKLLQLPKSQRIKLKNFPQSNQTFLVEIIAYCLMPNHFHLLLKQTQNNGITTFMRLVQNSYCHYFNTKWNRKGTLFEGRFKSVLVETDEQLLHLSRYIHLNPYSSFLVKDVPSLMEYKYSSLPEYLKMTASEICQKQIILDQFPTINDYKNFVLNQADYQRTLDQIKHQTLEYSTNPGTTQKK